MKLPAIIIICCLIIFVLLGFLFVGYTEQSKYSELQEKQIQGLKEQNQMQRDSLENELKLTRDSLSIALNTILLKHEESVLARERTQKMIRNYEAILYISYSSDSARVNAIKKLYPSWK